MRSGTVVAASAAVLALAAGVIIGLAAPREASSPTTQATASADPNAALLAQQAERVEALAAATVAGRLDGARVIVLEAAGTPAEARATLDSTLAAAGARVVASATLGEDWWLPEVATYRGELATQLTESVAGVDGLGAAAVLEHAIAQALLPGQVPAGLTAPAADAADLADGSDPRTAALLEVLTRSGILIDPVTGDERADAIIILAGEGPASAGTVASRAAQVWELYASATVVVVTATTADPEAAPALPTVAAEAIDDAGKAPASSRPSVVVLTDATLAPAQITMALVEQRQGGSGNYGAFVGLKLVAAP